MTVAKVWDGAVWVPVVGAQGPKGDKGDAGPPSYEAAPLGGVLTFSGKTLPAGWVLADGGRYTQALYPQGYAFAGVEQTAGNPFWTQRTSDATFTVPNLTDKFLLTQGAKAFGTPGGEENHALTGPEVGPHTHGITVDSAQIVPAGGYVVPYAGGWVPFVGGGGSAANLAASSTGVITGGLSGAHVHTAAAGTNTPAGTAHNTMPPYVAIAQIVKVAGAVVSAGAITGPPGQGVPVGGSTGQVLSKKTGTDYDTQWSNTLLPAEVTSLPASPSHGQEIYYRFQQSVVPADAKWIVWHLRYDSTGGAWYPVGSQDPVYAYYGPNESTGFGANTWGGISANDPLVTAPRTGDYEVQWGCGQFWANTVGNWYIAAYYVGAEQTANGTQPNSDIAAASGTGTWGGAYASKRMNITATTQIKQRYYITAAATSLFRGTAYIKLYPRRITG